MPDTCAACTRLSLRLYKWHGADLDIRAWLRTLLFIQHVHMSAPCNSLVACSWCPYSCGDSPICPVETPLSITFDTCQHPHACQQLSAFVGVQLVTFEAFRDLIKLLQLSISEETGIALADDENLEHRANAKSTAVGQYSQQIAQAAGRPAPGAPAGDDTPSTPARPWHALWMCRAYPLRPSAALSQPASRVRPL